NQSHTGKQRADSMSKPSNGPWRVWKIFSLVSSSTKHCAWRAEEYGARYDTEAEAQAECDRLNALEAQAAANREIADAAREYVRAADKYAFAPKAKLGKRYKLKCSAWDAFIEAVRKHTTET